MPRENRSIKTKGVIPDIREWRMEQGISQVDLAKRLGVNEMTIVNWEIRGMISRIRTVRERLSQTVEGVEKFLSPGV